MAARVVAAPDPARMPRATKNQAEIAGTRAAHRRDGAAVAKLLAWLDRQPTARSTRSPSSTSSRRRRRQTGEETQMPLRDDLLRHHLRRRAERRHHALPRVERHQPHASSHGDLFLLDSGAQYQDGTTDITRTVAIGTPSAEMRERFTLVLKGMIAHFACCAFPPGTRGADIDAFARHALGRPGSISPTAPAMASAPSCRCTRVRSASAKSGTEKLLDRA